MTTSDFAWTKSSYSGPQSNCLETAAGQLHGVTPVRDSKRPAGPVLLIPDAGWRAFTDALKTGDLGRG
ncbi:DUF397 domain-containing protein [Streptomyces sp. DW26H14]|uniref:DUF397 domain-containing protein n=1 Tax=Streptomyces sp. DW26H14 TaxID=3435395 RepID=UPI00403DBA38